MFLGLIKKSRINFFGENSTMSKRRLIAAAVILAITFSLTGCLSSGPQFTKPEAPSSAQSIVYFYRTNHFLTNATAPGVIHNGKKVLSFMVSGGFWKYYINPGVHLFEPQQLGIYKREALTLTNDKPGQTYYVEVVVRVGYIGFKHRSEAIGLAGISECYKIDSPSNRQSAPSTEEPLKTEISTKTRTEVPPATLPKTEAPQVSANGPASIHVATHPDNARVRIMNIKPKFHQGIELKPGKYHMEISARGYITKSKWVTLSKGETLNLDFTLLTIADKTISTPQVQPVKKAAIAHTNAPNNPKITDPKIAEIAQMLGSKNPVLKRNAAKLIIRNYPDQPQLLELAGQELEKGHNTLLTNRNHVDAMAWLCKAIGTSGDPGYKTFLMKIANQTQNRKIKNYALQNANLL